MLQSKEGQRVPEAVFRTREGAEWKNVTTDELFGGKTVIVFSLPGAFTPTCSSTHVPRYNDLAPVFRANGVDEIVCISVNDAFVMNAWKQEQQADNIRFIPDGTGEFTRGMGMLVNKNDLGFGDRSWRYSMLVRDGVIEKMFIEPEVEGDPFEVSDAETMLANVCAEASMPADVTVFTREGCPYCVKAKALLDKHGYEYTELVLHRDFRGSTLRAISGRDTVPQVFIDGRHIGGSDDLERWLDERKAA